jgi:hypothetical protein
MKSHKHFKTRVASAITICGLVRSQIRAAVPHSRLHFLISRTTTCTALSAAAPWPLPHWPPLFSPAAPPSRRTTKARSRSAFPSATASRSSKWSRRSPPATAWHRRGGVQRLPAAQRGAGRRRPGRQRLPAPALPGQPEQGARLRHRARGPDHHRAAGLLLAQDQVHRPTARRRLGRHPERSVERQPRVAAAAVRPGSSRSSPRR